jgi:catechol 2,3-dioxygenase-like lactoylglutathione lyase family enzyme
MTANVRYIVNELESAVDFYGRLGFEVKMKPGPGFAMLQRDGLTLYLNTPQGGGGAGQALDDGSVPHAGGWNRFQLEVDDLAAEIERLKSFGVRFRSDVIDGSGGKQALAEDPSGNLVELFEPK